MTQPRRSPGGADGTGDDHHAESVGGNQVGERKSAPALSVLVPVFNTRRYLQAAIDSIRRQKYSDLEIIVIDDGSKDGSTPMLQSIAREEPRMRLIVRENRGLIETRNELLESAAAPFIAWMDSDDISLPARLERQMGAMLRDPSLLCVGTWAQCIDPSGRKLNLETYPAEHSAILRDQQEKGGALRFATAMMRTRAAREVGGFRAPFEMGEDFDLLLRLGERGRMANLQEVLYLYRQHTSSVCASLGARWPVYRDEILALARERRETGSDRLIRGERLKISAPAVRGRSGARHVYLSWAEIARGNRDRGLAINYSIAALLRWPFSLTAWRSLVRSVVLR